jgi:hypothetical protein
MVKPGTRKNRLEPESKPNGTFSLGRWPSEDTIVAGSRENTITLRDVLSKARVREIQERRPFRQSFQRQRFSQRNFQNQPQTQMHAPPQKEFEPYYPNIFCGECDYRNKMFRNPTPENMDRWCLVAMTAKQKNRNFQCPKNRPQPQVRPQSTSQVVTQVHTLSSEELKPRYPNIFCEECDYRNKMFRNPTPENMDRWCLIAITAKQEGKNLQCPFKPGNDIFGKVIVVKPEKQSQPQTPQKK